MPSVVDLAYQLSPEPMILSVRTAGEINPFTCRHCIEQELGHPGRFMKRFVGQTRMAGQLIPTDTYYYCRLLVPNTDFVYERLVTPLSAQVGAGGIYSSPLRAMLKQHQQRFAADPWWAMQGPPLSAAQCQELLAQEHDVYAPQDIVRTYQPPIKL